MKKDKKNFLIIIFVALVIGVSFLFIFINKKKEYVVTFNSGEKANTIERKVVSGKKVNKPVNPKKEGHIFIEWLYDGKTYDFNTEVTKDMVLEAKWQKINSNGESFIVQFETDGGTTISSQILGKNSKARKPKDPVKPNYKFRGWYANNEKYDFDSVVTRNTTVQAKWEKIVTYTITFNSNNGTTVKSQKVITGEKVIKPTDPTRSGYKFNNWYNGKKIYDFNEEVYENITLTAKWDVAYKVKFNTNGGNTIESQNIVKGGKVVKPTDPVKVNYIFKNWKLDNEVFDFNTTISKNITLEAEWQEAYTITFDSKGGSSIEPLAVEKGEKATKPTAPTKAGYTFVGWMLNDEEFDFNKVLTSSITLDAKWNPISYTISYNGNGNDNGQVMEESTCTYGTDCKLKGNQFTKAGYTFNGWTAVVNGKTITYTDQQVVSNLTTVSNGKVEMIANWKVVE